MTTKVTYNEISYGPNSGSFFSNGAAPNAHYIRNKGRLFLGESAEHDGSTDDGSPNPTGSWLQSFPSEGLVNPIVGWDYMEDNARHVSTNTFGVAATFASQNNTLDGIGVIASVVSMVPGENVWAVYGDGVKTTAGAASVFTVELNAGNLPSVSPHAGSEPHKAPTDGMVQTLRLAAGSDADVVGDSYAIDSFLETVNNGAVAYSGINFGYNSIKREGQPDDQVVTNKGFHDSYGKAINMAYYHGLTWWSRDASGVTGNREEALRIWSQVESADKTWRVCAGEDTFIIGEGTSPDNNNLIIPYVEDSATGLAIVPGELGDAQTLEVRGTNADIVLKLSPKGTAWVQIPIANVQDYANDAAAALGGISVGGIYRNGSALMIRVT